MKEPIHIVIADADPKSAANLGRQLENHPDFRVVGYARGASEAACIVAETQPSVMIVDITSLRDEAMAVVADVGDPGLCHRPLTMVLTAFGHEQITQRCVDLGADYYVLKPPGDGVIADRIRRLAGGTCAAGAASVAEREERAKAAASALRSIGVPAHIKGHLYLREAIVAVMQQPGLLDAITKELYPTIAAAQATTPARVERAIRHAIDVAWRDGPPPVAQDLFGTGNPAAKLRPSNSALIAAIARMLACRSTVGGPGTGG